MEVVWVGPERARGWVASLVARPRQSPEGPGLARGESASGRSAPLMTDSLLATTSQKRDVRGETLVGEIIPVGVK